MNNFILSYGPFGSHPTDGQILNHVRTDRSVAQYFQPFAGTILLKSEKSTIELNQGFSGLFETTQYMLTLFPPIHSSGVLPSQIWSWINQGDIPPAPPMPPSVGKLLYPSAVLDALRNHKE